MTKKIHFTTVLLLTIAQIVIAQLPPEFSDQLVSDEFEYPMGLVAAEDGRLYVWEKQGRLYVMDTEGNRNNEPLIDLREEIADWQDHGLNCVALHPNFLENGYFYLLYVVERNYWLNFGSPNYHPDSVITDEATFARVVRYTADPASDFTSILPGSRKVLVGVNPGDGLPILYEFHGVGTLLIGTDETLLISIGDGTRAFTSDGKGGDKDSYTFQAIDDEIITEDQAIQQYKAQYLGSLNGKIVRIDPETGAGLPSNPYFDPDNPRSPQSRIWAAGFRNPYRMTMRPETGSHFAGDGNPGTIYAGDVGNASWEELDIVTEGGQNFGWPIIEGLYINWGLHNTWVPDNVLAPNPLYGAPGCEDEFLDFKEVFFRELPEGKSHSFPNPCDPSFQLPEEVFPQVGKLPVIQWSHAKWNLPTKAEVPYFNEDDKARGYEIEDPKSGLSGENFDGFSSLAGTFYTGDAFPEEYHGSFFSVDFSGWIRKFDFNEDNKLLSVSPFYDNVKKVIHLTENPLDGCLYFVNQKDEIRKICFGGNPRPIAIANADLNFGTSPLAVQFDASDSYDVFGDPISFHWDFGNGDSSSLENPQHVFTAPNAEPTSFEIRLTVTDSAGASQTDELIISLNNTPPEVEISSFKDGDKYPITQSSILVLEAEVFDVEHDLSELKYEWQIFTHHNDHFHPSPIREEPKTFAIISPLGCAEEPYWYRIELEVTDPEGLSTSVSQQIFPNCDEDFVEFGALTTEFSRIENSLFFETLYENTVANLEVQRSTNYLDFEVIGTIEPRGNPNNTTSYSFTDTNPRHGSNIYRIKAISPNQAFEYTEMLPIIFPQEPAIDLLPNPTDGAINLKVKEIKSEVILLEVFTEQGVLVFERNWEADLGISFSEIVLLNQLPTAVYFYRVKNGDEESVGKIIIR